MPTHPGYYLLAAEFEIARSKPDWTKAEQLLDKFEKCKHKADVKQLIRYYNYRCQTAISKLVKLFNDACTFERNKSRFTKSVFFDLIERPTMDVIFPMTPLFEKYKMEYGLLIVQPLPPEVEPLITTTSNSFALFDNTVKKLRQRLVDLNSRSGR